MIYTTHRYVLFAYLACLATSMTCAGAERIRYTVTVDDHPIAVWSKTPKEPIAAILLIHGRTWSGVPDFDLQVPGKEASLMDGLVERGIAAYAVDLRGYGATPRDHTGWLTPNRAALDTKAVLNWLAMRHDLGLPHVFGWSYGAMVAQLTVQQFPAAANRLVLFGYPVRPGIDRNPTNTEVPQRVPTSDRAAAEDFITPSATDPDVIQQFVIAARKHDPVRADWRGLDQWRALDGAQVSNSTLVIQAALDPLARTHVHAKLFARLANPDKSWVVVPGGDHAAFLEAPRRYFLDTLATFLLSPRVSF